MVEEVSIDQFVRGDDDHRDEKPDAPMRNEMTTHDGPSISVVAPVFKRQGLRDMEVPVYDDLRRCWSRRR